MWSKVPTAQLLFDPKNEITAHKKLSENRKQKVGRIDLKQSRVITQQGTMADVNKNNGKNNVGTPC